MLFGVWTFVSEDKMEFHGVGRNTNLPQVRGHRFFQKRD